MKHHTFVKVLFLLSLVISPVTLADWQLNNSKSTLSFVSIKKGKVAEVHTFKTLQGTVNKQGQVKLYIDLASVNTHIDIRDKRMNEHLFQIKQFPKASLSGKLDLSPIHKLAIGETVTTNISFTLDLHGLTKSLDAQLVVTKLTSGIQVSSLAPVIVNAADFGLLGGINKLRELANLPSIASAVPVSVNLQFIEK